MKALTDRSRFWLVTLAAVLTAALTFSLGQWQLGRASQKLALQFSLEQKKSLPVLGNGRSAKLAWQMQDYNPLGAAGNAAAATAEKGRTLVSAAGKGLAALLVELAGLPHAILTDHIGPF